MKDLLLITPPFTQLNTPYPATAYLKGFLNTKEISAFQMDLGIEVIHRLFSKEGLKEVFRKGAQKGIAFSENAQRIYALKHEYIKTIDAVVAFLQGKDLTFARQICSENFLPQASRFEQSQELDWAFGTMGMQDRAKHLATLYLEDISDFIIEVLDDHFGFSRYAEKLGMSANTFDDLYNELHKPSTFVDDITLEILDKQLQSLQPKLVCFSVPFPGNLYSALKCGQFMKIHYPGIKIAMGGGFPNTELRTLTDARVFEFVDFITLDDGELPIELLSSNILSPTPDNPDFQFFKRTLLLENGKVVYKNNTLRKDYKQSEVGTPDYSDLLLSKYISVIEVTNPMHSLWSDGRWNKLTMAHGCYWGKCTFCDVSLDYIKIYEPIAAKLLVDRMEQLIAQTGENGFHFVDEAAPPALMRSLAFEIIKRELTVTWWANIRFEKAFSRDLCKLLKASGCVAVSGGLEVASDRLLNLIQKGVTVAQVAQVTRNFAEAGIMVHSYLMYGYPTQTIQETVDSLEMVRQMFEIGVIQSAFWHQFALTAHSPIGLNTAEYGIIPDLKDSPFANNDIQFEDSTGIDHSQFSYGLRKSLYNFMQGQCFELPLQEWFDFKIPRTSISPNFIMQCLEQEHQTSIKENAKVIWLGSQPQSSNKRKSKNHVQLTFHDKSAIIEIELEKDKALWLAKQLKELSAGPITYGTIRQNYESDFRNFEQFWHSEEIQDLRDNGLLVL
ncbi:radical SAM protein [Marivirga sp. S37H4]|uniref:Radical SAM protein n=1 Tax=Marivirga aurantiaca TaxID=2802615 RepID=A0A934WYL2_9BACT|nr:radical SAM protein [Marivirga aurantiaca]MBK6265559.1 radical SAM protein [Marivirga aurantiaca]